MAEGIGGLLERSRERLLGPRVVKFSNGLRMTASISGSEPKVTLQRGSQVLVDLKSFAPEGTIVKFDPKGKWGAIPQDATNRPVLIMGKFESVEAILDYLHECGHLQDPASTDLALTLERRYYESFFNKDPNNHSYERFKVLSERNEAVVHSERDAWAFSLKNIRQLEQQFGIDIISKLGGVKNVFNYVNSYVQKYEQHTMTELEYLGIQIYSKKEIEKLVFLGSS